MIKSNRDWRGAAVAIALAGLLSWSLEAAAQSPEEVLSNPGPLPERAFGRPDAPVTVIEYASLTCDHCKNFHVTTWPAVKEKYVDTGKVRFVLREFFFDPLALGGFMMARCSGEDKWYSVVDRLFRSDDALAHAENPLLALRDIMGQTGMSREAFEKCLSDQKLFADLKEVARRGRMAGVTGTPTFFFNGRKEVGDMTLEEFSAIVDPLLESK